MKAFLIGLLLGTIVGVFAMQNHVVRTRDGVVVIPRANRPPLRTTMADVRDWSLSMWEQYPELKSAVVQAGRSDLLAEKGLGKNPNENRSPGQIRPTAAHPASDSEVAIRFLQEERPLAPIGSPMPPSPSEEQHHIRSRPPSAERSTSSAFSPFEAILGLPAPFPSNSSAPGRSDEDREFVFPSRPKRVGPGHPAPAVSQPQQGVFKSVAPSTSAPQQSAGPSAEWVRGLLKSLIPSAETGPAEERADTGTMSAPAPATASQSWKPISFQEFLQPQPPLRAVRPF